MCLRAEQITERSTIPPSGGELLNRQGFTFPAANGASLASVPLRWMLVVVVGIMIVL